MAGRIVLQTGTEVFREINQVSHGFSVGDWVRLQGTEVYVKAQADNDVNAETVGRIWLVKDVDNFIVQYDGFFDSGVPNEPSGTVYFLDPITAGATTKDDSIFVSGDISKPAFIVVKPNEVGWMLRMRGIEISAPTESFDRFFVEADATIVSTRTITVGHDILPNRENVTLNGQIVYEGSAEAYQVTNNQVIFNNDVDLIVGDKIRIDYFYV